MAFLDTVTKTCGYRARCEDRVAVLSASERTVIVVADGAGGMGSGDQAVETVIREVEAAYTSIHSANEWASLLRQIDCRIFAGESTAVVADVRPYGIAGASVGDSQAWIVQPEQFVNLTDGQQRKPLLGSGLANPVPFQHPPLRGILLVATDGFTSYVKRDKLSNLIAESDFWSLARQCVEMVRLPSGELWDDVAVVAARTKPPQRCLQRYVI